MQLRQIAMTQPVGVRFGRTPDTDALEGDERDQPFFKPLPKEDWGKLKRQVEGFPSKQPVNQRLFKMKSRSKLESMLERLHYRLLTGKVKILSGAGDLKRGYSIPFVNLTIDDKPYTLTGQVNMFSLKSFESFRLFNVQDNILIEYNQMVPPFRNVTYQNRETDIAFKTWGRAATLKARAVGLRLMELLNQYNGQKTQEALKTVVSPDELKF